MDLSNPSSRRSRKTGSQRRALRFMLWTCSFLSVALNLSTLKGLLPIYLDEFALLSVPNKIKESPRKFELTYTRFGWFHENETIGIQHPRLLTSKNFTNAVTAHPWFNASVWDDLNKSPDADRPIIAFLDIETCKEFNWPHFGGDSDMASDVDNGRSPWGKGKLLQTCPTLQKALKSPAIAASPDSRLVVMNCEGMRSFWSNCAYNDRDPEEYKKLVVVHLSSHKDQVNQYEDFGIPPLAVRPVFLSDQEVNDIQSCKAATRRKYFFSFQGRRRTTFPEYHEYLEPLHGKDGIHAIFGLKHYIDSNTTSNKGMKVLQGSLDAKEQASDPYFQLLRESVFTGCPRGDILQSYRFAEVLSAGSIPVLYADGYVLPYLDKVVDWNEAAVLIAQKDVNRTLDILRGLTLREICEKQKKVLEFYQNYVKNSHGRLRGIIESVVLRKESDVPIPIASAPGDAPPV